MPGPACPACYGVRREMSSTALDTRRGLEELAVDVSARWAPRFDRGIEHVENGHIPLLLRSACAAAGSPSDAIAVRPGPSQKAEAAAVPWHFRHPTARRPLNVAALSIY